MADFYQGVWIMKGRDKKILWWGSKISPTGEKTKVRKVKFQTFDQGQNWQPVPAFIKVKKKFR